MINNIVNSKFLGGLTATVAFTGVMANADIANALIKTQTYTETFDLAPTGIVDEVLSIQKFNDNLGTLQRVILGFNGEIVGSVEVESRDAVARTVTFDLDGQLKLWESTNTLNNPLFDEVVVGAGTFEATAFDGSIDFAGTSGTVYDGPTAVFNGQNIYIQQADLDFFTGLGNVDFLFSASSDLQVTSGGRLTLSTETDAGASVTVTYEYEAVGVPEPSAILGLGLFAGAGILSKKKLGNKA